MSFSSSLDLERFLPAHEDKEIKTRGTTIPGNGESVLRLVCSYWNLTCTMQVPPTVSNSALKHGPVPMSKRNEVGLISVYTTGNIVWASTAITCTRFHWQIQGPTIDSIHA